MFGVDVSPAMCLLMAIAVLKAVENLIKLTGKRPNVITRTTIPTMEHRKMKKVVLFIDINRHSKVVLIAPHSACIYMVNVFRTYYD